ncbi:MAG TPA: glycerol-3-phosphate acyltransferase [Acidimicrobiales bacterium]|nr:glycerol-3-phosphate acyltransferase [Acidimicrobiales bacterium]
MRAVGLVAGLAVLGAYLLGSVPFGFLFGRRSIRRGLRRIELAGRPLDDQLLAILTGGGAAGSPLVAVLDTAKVLLAATAAWHLVIAVSPGGSATRPNQSAVAFLSDQVLVSWQSAALWAGMAAVVGHLAPVWLGFRSDHGQAPALGLAVVYVPVGFVLGVLVFFLARAVLGHGRVVAAVVTSLGAFVGWCWMAWIADVQVAWGVPAGPELSLWAAVLAGVLAARTIRTGG